MFIWLVVDKKSTNTVQIFCSPKRIIYDSDFFEWRTEYSGTGRRMCLLFWCVFIPVTIFVYLVFYDGRLMFKVILTNNERGPKDEFICAQQRILGTMYDDKMITRGSTFTYVFCMKMC